MTSELEATVDRYCELVSVMEHGQPGVTDFQALYSKVKVEQELFIQLKYICQKAGPLRLRFKAAHIRMQALEQRLKGEGIMLLVPPAQSFVLVLENGEERRIQVCPRQPQARVRRSLPILFAVVGILIFGTGLLVGLHCSGYL